jgi:hypothetical protein
MGVAAVAELSWLACTVVPLLELKTVSTGLWALASEAPNKADNTSKKEGERGENNLLWNMDHQTQNEIVYFVYSTAKSKLRQTQKVICKGLHKWLKYLHTR